MRLIPIAPDRVGVMHPRLDPIDPELFDTVQTGERTAAE
jgi:hypothetical protein